MSLSSLQGLTLKPLSGKNSILLSEAHFINLAFFIGKHVKRLISKSLSTSWAFLYVFLLSKKSAVFYQILQL